MTIVLVRHGETEWSASETSRLAGFADRAEIEPDLAA